MKSLFDLLICNILENLIGPILSFEFCQKSPPSTNKTCSSLQITWYSKWSGLGWEFEIHSISKINLLMLNPFEKLTNEGGTVTDNIPLGAMRVCAKPPFRDSYIARDAQTLLTAVSTGRRIRIKRIIMGFVEDGIGQFATCWETFLKSDWNSQLANDLSPFRLVMMSPPGRFKTRSLYKTGLLEGLKIQGS